MHISLYHLGDRCGPGIIIDDILKQKKKCLFMLGFYPFNDILHYLNDNHYENIYNKKYLLPDANDSTFVYHTGYNFIFNHDYVTSNGEITNYDFVKQRFDLKIKNFREMLGEDNLCIFINFTDNVAELKIVDMLIWLNNHKKNFHLIIFTTNPDVSSYYSEHDRLSIIMLKKQYNSWFTLPKEEKMDLYREIYGEFLECLKVNHIIHDFPKSFEETHYFINNS